jgi:hypothetical protein
MEYNKIIAVSGLPGLHEMISSKTDGAIVRSLDDKSTKFVSSRIHNFSHLESIEIFTVRDNVNLVDILQAMQKSSKALPDTKDNAAVKKYFESAYPDIDFDRVYSSDMKKIIKWFEILQNNKVEIKLSEPVAEEEPVEVVEEKAPVVKEKSKAAKAVKEETVEEAPKKKAAPKKKEAEAAPEKPAKKAVAKAAPKAAAKEKKEEAPKKKAAPKKK